MNIGIVTVWDERGAGYVSKIYKDYLSSYFKVFIYNRGYSKNKLTQGNYIYNAQKVSSSKPMSIHKKEFKRWIDKNKIETILFNEQQSWEPIIWCKEWKIKTVAYIDYYTEETVPLHDAYDLLICNTKRHLEAFKKHKNAKYYPWGTDIEIFTPKKNSNKTPVFLHSCGYSPTRKGTDSLLKAFKNIELDFKLIIHTQVDLKKALSDSITLIENLLESGKMELINKTIPAPGLYYLADYYVYPTKLEGIGLTIAESISSGLIPIIPNSSPMIEFLPEEFKFKINVDREVSRFDGYYWPQCIISEKHLKEIIYLAINEFPNQNLKSSLREWAIKKLDFRKNFKNLENEINNLKFHKVDHELIHKIRCYELNRPLSHKKTVKYLNKFYKVFYPINNFFK